MDGTYVLKGSMYPHRTSPPRARAVWRPSPRSSISRWVGPTAAAGPTSHTPPAHSPNTSVIRCQFLRPGALLQPQQAARLTRSLCCCCCCHCPGMGPPRPFGGPPPGMPPAMGGPPAPGANGVAPGMAAPGMGPRPPGACALHGTQQRVPPVAASPVTAGVTRSGSGGAAATMCVNTSCRMQDKGSSHLPLVQRGSGSSNTRTVGHGSSWCWCCHS
jgi:hypothetical protein